MKRKEILSKVDPLFIHHGEYSKELPIVNYNGSQYKGIEFMGYNGKPEYCANFEVGSATTPGLKYKVQVLLPGLGILLRDKSKVMLMRDRVLKAVSDMDILVWCPCKAYTFWGYAFLDTQYKIILPKRKQGIPPNVRNPRRRGIICKHLDLCLRTLPFLANSIVGDIKKKELVPEPTKTTVKKPIAKPAVVKTPIKPVVKPVIKTVGKTPIKTVGKPTIKSKPPFKK